MLALFLSLVCDWDGRTAMFELGPGTYFAACQLEGNSGITHGSIDFHMTIKVSINMCKHI